MKPICKFLLDPRDEPQTNYFLGGVLKGIFGGMHKSKVQKYVGNHLGYLI